jgi:diacylglycerol kinase (ATP)
MHSSPDAAESPHKGQRGLRRLVNAFFFSLSGLALAFRHESAFRQEIALAAVLLPLAFVLPVTAAERVLLTGSVLLVLVVELLNSSVEAAIDRISLDTHRLSKRAKDLGSAAVLVALALLAFTWFSLAVPALMAWAATMHSTESAGFPVSRHATVMQRADHPKTIVSRARP